MSTFAADTDTIDVADLVRSIRRGWKYIIAGLLIGALAAAAVLLFVSPRFRGVSSIVIRSPEPTAGSLTAKLGGSLQSAASELLPSTLNSAPIETELQILSSRSLAGEAVDSLLLQVRMRSAQRVAPWQAFVDVRFPGSFKHKRLDFKRVSPGSYFVASGSEHVTARVGAPATIAGGSLVISNTALPPSFAVDVYDREEAITRFQDRLSVSKAGGEVVAIAYQGYDSLTAAAVPNLLVRRYLVRRLTTDRGINERRVEFLRSEVDSTEVALNAAERALRREQEASGVIDPVVVGKLELERASDLRNQEGELDVERGAIGQMLSQLASGQLSSRQLAAYPAFLKSPAVNDLLSQLATLETKRLALLATLTPEDPSVVAATEGIENIEAQLAPLARAYRLSLDRQRADVARQIDTLQASITTLPATTESSVRLQRDVLRLGQINAAVRAQLVDAKLAAIGEGGDVRILDVADAPRKVAFPTKTMTLSAGLGGGFMLGIVLAVLAGLFGRYVFDAPSIERQIGVPALALDGDTPLVLAGAQSARTILLVPLDETADTAGVAERIMRSATARGLRGSILDFSSNGSPEHVRTEMLTSSSTEFDLVAVRLRRLASDATLAALREDRPVLFVASAGRVDRRSLSAGVETLRRFGVPCAGVVLSRRAPLALAHG